MGKTTLSIRVDGDVAKWLKNHYGGKISLSINNYFKDLIIETNRESNTKICFVCKQLIGQEEKTVLWKPKFSPEESPTLISHTSCILENYSRVDDLYYQKLQSDIKPTCGLCGLKIKEDVFKEDRGIFFHKNCYNKIEGIKEKYPLTNITRMKILKFLSLDYNISSIPLQISSNSKYFHIRTLLFQGYIIKSKQGVYVLTPKGEEALQQLQEME